MSKILVIAEIKDGKFKKASREAVSVGKQKGESVDAFLAGEGAGAVAGELGKYGAGTIYAADVAEYNPEAEAKTIARIAGEKGYNVILFSHDWQGRDVSARVAAHLNTMVLSDATELKIEGNQAEILKPVYSGKALVRLKSKSDIAIVSIRSNAFTIEESAGEGKVEAISLDATETRAKMVNFEAVETKRISLTEADIVVTGGRGIKEAENYKLIEDMADLLGAATGATRAVVDAGWADHALQVGQTGQTVSPNLYFAIGVSGAIQHLAGMSSSKNIVAINKDPEAPIFKVATYGIVDNLFNIMPTLQEELQKIVKG